MDTMVVFSELTVNNARGTASKWFYKLCDGKGEGGWRLVFL